MGGKAKEKAKDKSSVKGKEAPPLEDGEEKGGLLIRYIWTQGMDIIYNMRVVNTDALSYQSKTQRISWRLPSAKRRGSTSTLA